MAARHKQSSNLPYLVALALLALYTLVLIFTAFGQSDGFKWLLYGLIPDMFSIYLALHGFHQNRFNEQHVERHLSNIERFVRIIAGVDDEPKEFDA
jgi:hypothetical protein